VFRTSEIPCTKGLSGPEHPTVCYLIERNSSMGVPCNSIAYRRIYRGTSLIRNRTPPRTTVGT